ncbi:MAG: CoA transferase [Dehalococcoidia bacterium]|nr:CoA transferase [Dehalococcoidia bacterium]
MTVSALSDLRVVDLSVGEFEGMAGAFCAKMFADFGADVIKVEPPGGDPSRKLGPFPHDNPDIDTGGMFRYLNTNKRGVTVDLNSSEGRDRLQDLCATADVVVGAGLKPRITYGAGSAPTLTYADLVVLNPGIVVVSVTPFGQTGPWRDYQATDLVMYGASGQSYVNGSPDREPLKEPGDESCFQAGACAFLGAMTALAHRDLTGEGQHVDLSMQEAAVSAFSPQVLGAMHRGAPEKRGSTPLLPCKDGYVSLNVRHDATWEYMWLFFDDPDIAYNPRYATTADRRRHAAEIEEMLRPHLARHTMEDLFHGLAPLRLLIGMTLTVDRLLIDPHLEERDFFVRSNQLKAGHEKGTMPGAPFKMSATPWTLRSEAPDLGEHDAELQGD